MKTSVLLLFLVLFGKQTICQTDLGIDSTWTSNSWDSLTKLRPINYLYPKYVVSQCRVIVKSCKTCPQRVIKVWRKQTDTTDASITFYKSAKITLPDVTVKDKIIFRQGWLYSIFGMELIFVAWYDMNW